jgi:hypothetical protein
MVASQPPLTDDCVGTVLIGAPYWLMSPIAPFGASAATVPLSDSDG